MVHHKREDWTPPTSKGHGSRVDNSPLPALCNMSVRTVVKFMYLWSVCLRGELGFLNCDNNDNKIFI